MPQELVIALIAAGAALAGSLLGSFFTRSTEHKQWLRNQKQSAYFAAYAALSTEVVRLKGLRDLENIRQPDAVGANGAFMTPINVLSPSAVNHAVPKLLRQLDRTATVAIDVSAPDRNERLSEEYDSLDALLAEFLRQIRRDLKTGDLPSNFSYIRR